MSHNLQLTDKEKEKILAQRTLQFHKGVKMTFYDVYQDSMDKHKDDSEYLCVKMHGEDLRLIFAPLGFFRPEIPQLHAIRMKMLWFTEWNLFENTVLFLILLNGLVMAHPVSYDPDSQPKTLRDAYFVFDSLLTLIFIVECFARIIARGLFFGTAPDPPYLKESSNWLDFSVVVFSIIDVVASGVISKQDAQSLRVLRVARLTRLMKGITGLPRLKTIVMALSRSTYRLVLSFCAIVFMLVVIASLATNLFGDVYWWRCRLTETPVDINGTLVWPIDDSQPNFCGGRYECKAAPDGSPTYCRSPVSVTQGIIHPNFDPWPEIFNNPNADRGFTGFQTPLAGILTVWQVVNIDGWSELMSRFMDAKWPVLVVIFFVLLMLFGGLVLMNLVLAILWDSFDKIVRENKEAAATKKTLKEAESMDPKPVVTQEIHDMPLHKLMEETTKLEDYLAKSELFKTLDNEMRHQGLRNVCYSIVANPIFGRFMLFAITFNAVIMAFDGYPPQGDMVILILDRINFFCSLLFAAEVMMKIIGIGVAFFEDSGNRFDFLLVTLSMIEMMGSGGSALSALRTARLLRIFRMISRSMHMRILLIVFQRAVAPTMYFSVIVIVFLYCSALAGIQLFYSQDIEYKGGGLGFDFFGMGFLTALSIFAGNEWVETMLGELKGKHNQALGFVYYIITFCFGKVILRNLLLGVIAAEFTVARDGMMEDCRLRLAIARIKHQQYMAQKVIDHARVEEEVAADMAAAIAANENEPASPRWPENAISRLDPAVSKTCCKNMDILKMILTKGGAARRLQSQGKLHAMGNSLYQWPSGPRHEFAAKMEDIADMMLQASIEHSNEANAHHSDFDFQETNTGILRHEPSHFAAYPDALDEQAAVGPCVTPQHEKMHCAVPMKPVGGTSSRSRLQALGSSLQPLRLENSEPLQNHSSAPCTGDLPPMPVLSCRPIWRQAAVQGQCDAQEHKLREPPLSFREHYRRHRAVLSSCAGVAMPPACEAAALRAGKMREQDAAQRTDRVPDRLAHKPRDCQPSIRELLERARERRLAEAGQHLIEPEDEEAPPHRTGRLAEERRHLAGPRAVILDSMADEDEASVMPPLEPLQDDGFLDKQAKDVQDPLAPTTRAGQPSIRELLARARERKLAEAGQHLVKPEDEEAPPHQAGQLAKERQHLAGPKVVKLDSALDAVDDSVMPALEPGELGDELLDEEVRPQYAKAKKVAKPKSSEAQIEIFRQCAKSIMRSPAFEPAVLFMIIASSFSLALESPYQNPDSEAAILQKVVDQVSIVVVTFEMIVRMLAQGLWKSPESCGEGELPGYFRVGWHILDFFVCISGITYILADSMVGNLGSLKVVRAFKMAGVLRPIRLLGKSSGVRLIIEALLTAIPTVINMAFISCLFLFGFALLFVGLYKGALYRCSLDPLGINRPDIVTKKHCLQQGGSWDRDVSNFDNFGQSMVSVMHMMTGQGWIDVTLGIISTTGVEMQPRPNTNFLTGFAVVVTFMALTNFFLLNLLIGILVDSYATTKAEFMGQGSATSDERLIVKLQREVLLNPYWLLPPKKLGLRGNYCYELRLRMLKVLDTQACRFAIFLGIFLNFFVMGAYSPVMDQDLRDARRWVGSLLLLAFTAELGVKWFVYGLDFFKDKWHAYDIVAVVGSDIGILVELLTPGDDQGAVTQVMGAFQILRMLMLVRYTWFLDSLVYTIWAALPGLLNVVALLTLTFFIYTCLGVGLFGTIMTSSQEWNFHSFGNALLVLIRCSTGEKWHDIMYDVAADKPGCTEEVQSYEDLITNGARGCGSIFAYPYFISYVLISMFILMNLIVAVVLDAYTAVHGLLDLKDFILCVKTLRSKWLKKDPQFTGYLSLATVEQILLGIPQPVGCARLSRRHILRQMMHFRVFADNTIHYSDVVVLMAQRSVQFLMGQPRTRSNAVRLDPEAAATWEQQFPDMPPDQGINQMRIAHIVIARRVSMYIRKKRWEWKLKISNPVQTQLAKLKVASRVSSTHAPKLQAQLEEDKPPAPQGDTQLRVEDLDVDVGAPQQQQHQQEDEEGTQPTEMPTSLFVSQLNPLSANNPFTKVSPLSPLAWPPEELGLLMPMTENKEEKDDAQLWQKASVAAQVRPRRQSLFDAIRA
eukprot:TRINITY_DN25182_c0_g1_i1.p1 TRINITY_DN25182_c0_g1~~TRINITY_DN25182_c0_g1_i1.p1  ORF type:complete len:2126 (+),score=363.59 TRINITY_DN25182_c0_g1_i1:138-6515(+)